jgi:phage major head subunit gpT-like protein
MSTFTHTAPELLEPFITEIFYNELNMIEARYPALFKMETSTRAFEEYLKMAGLDTFTTKLEGQPIAYDNPVQGNRVRRVAQTFALGFRITMEMREDDQHGIMAKMPSDLAEAARDHRENLAWGLLNDAFTGTTYTGFDGLALCTTHTNLKTGESQSNALSPAVALSVSGIQSALTTMRTTTNESGRFVQLRPTTIVCAPANEFNVTEILKTDKKVNSTENNINSVASSRTGLSDMIVEYLSSSTAWFLACGKNQHDLRWVTRKELSTDNNMDPYTKDMCYDAHYRAFVAFQEWRGIVGSAGTV